MLGMLIFAAAATTNAPPPARGYHSQPSVLSPLCKRSAPELVEHKHKQQVHARALNELPNADQYLAVMRFDQKGCEDPAIVAYDIGSAPKRQR